jgi:hypothetical protein
MVLFFVSGEWGGAGGYGRVSARVVLMIVRLAIIVRLAASVAGGHRRLI